MITAAMIYDEIHRSAPFDTAMSFDNVGILVGDPDAPAEKVLLALDATVPVIQEAVSVGASLIITHHPVIFHPLKRIEPDSIPYLAIRHGITILSAHTNLDIAPGGVNDTLAEQIGVTEDQRFDEHCALLGHLSEPLSVTDWAVRIQNRLGLNGLRFTDHHRMLNRILVSCGAGGDNIFLAAGCGADALVTGEIKHHEIIFANDHHIAVFDLGHFGSERAIIPVLCRKLQQQFPDTSFLCAASDTDNLQYLSPGGTFK